MPLRWSPSHGARYVEDRVAKAGETLALSQPFRWSIDPDSLR